MVLRWEGPCTCVMDSKIRQTFCKVPIGYPYQEHCLMSPTYCSRQNCVFKNKILIELSMTFMGARYC